MNRLMAGVGRTLPANDSPGRPLLAESGRRLTVDMQINA